MATPRLAASFFIKTSRTSIPCVARHFRTFPTPLPRHQTPRHILSRLSQTRFSSTSTGLPASKIYSFTDIQALSSSPSPNTILIDTREPAELDTTGTIPSSVNIPVTSQPDSFFISAEEFEDRYGFERPQKEQEVVFYCKAGVRSRAAAELAKAAGWTNVGEYPGSWLDWEKNGGKRDGGRESGN